MVNTEIRLIIFFTAKFGEALYSQQKQDQELTVAQIMKSLLPNSDLKKVGKTTRPFRYDLNQVRNRFKELDLIDRVPDELWTEVRDIVQETGIKTIPMEKKCKKEKLCPTLCDLIVARQDPLSMWVLRARILEWIAVPSSRGSSQSMD